MKDEQKLVVRAPIFLYVFARIYERICACRTVSLREIRTAVRECAFCRLDRPSP